MECFSSLFTVLPDVTNHILDKNSNQDVGPTSSQEVDSLNNLTSSSTNNSCFGLDQNLNMTLSPKPGEGLVPSNPLPEHQAIRPPSLSVISPLNKPDPSEVDDEAPVTSDSSPDSNLTPSRDICVDPDLLNGNVSADSPLMNTKLTCNLDGSNTSSKMITWVKHQILTSTRPHQSSLILIIIFPVTSCTFTQNALIPYDSQFSRWTKAAFSYMAAWNSSECLLLCIVNLKWSKCPHFAICVTLFCIFYSLQGLHSQYKTVSCSFSPAQPSFTHSYYHSIVS